MSLYQAGELEAARTLFADVDQIALSREQRQAMYDAQTDIARQLGDATPAAPAAEPQPAAPALTPQERLDRAARVASDDPGTAVALYTSVIDEGGPAADDAKAQLAVLLRQMNTDQTRAKAMLDEAEADLAAGRLTPAEAKLNAVGESSAELGWYDSQRVTRGLGRVAELRRGLAAEQSAAAAAAEASAGASDATEQDRQAAERAARRAAEAREAAVDATASEYAAGTNASPASDDLMSRARAATAEALVADAREARQNGFDQLAVNLLTQASELDPDNPRVRQSLDQANAARPINAIDSTAEQIELRRQIAIAEYNQNLDLARQNLDLNRFQRGDRRGQPRQAGHRAASERVPPQRVRTRCGPRPTRSRQGSTIGVSSSGSPTPSRPTVSRRSRKPRRPPLPPAGRRPRSASSSPRPASSRPRPATRRPSSSSTGPCSSTR